MSLNIPQVTLHHTPTAIPALAGTCFFPENEAVKPLQGRKIESQSSGSLDSNALEATVIVDLGCVSVASPRGEYQRRTPLVPLPSKKNTEDFGN